MISGQFPCYLGKQSISKNLILLNLPQKAWNLSKVLNEQDFLSLNFTQEKCVNRKIFGKEINNGGVLH